MSQIPQQDSSAKKAQVQDYFSRTAEAMLPVSLIAQELTCRD